MKRILFSARWMLVLAVFVILGGWVLLRGQGPTTTPTQAHQQTGLVGIADGQSARLNVINLNGQPVNVTLELISMNLTALASEDCAVEVPPDLPTGQLKPPACMLDPGQEVHLEFNSDALTLGIGERAYLRAHVSVSPGEVGDVITTLEIFDNATGKTVMHAGELCLISIN